MEIQGRSSIVWMQRDACQDPMKESRRIPATLVTDGTPVTGRPAGPHPAARLTATTPSRPTARNCRFTAVDRTTAAVGKDSENRDASEASGDVLVSRRCGAQHQCRRRQAITANRRGLRRHIHIQEVQTPNDFRQRIGNAAASTTTRSRVTGGSSSAASGPPGTAHGPAA